MVSAVVALLVPLFGFGQENYEHSIGLSYQKIDIGRGLQLDYGRKFGKDLKWQANIGVYYHFNSLPRDDQGYGYHNRGWAVEWINAIGLNLSLDYSLLTYGSTNVLVYLNSHLLRTGFRDKVYYPSYDPSTGGGIVYILDEGRIYDPFTTLENTLGIGLRTKIHESVGFLIRGGIGFASFYDPKAIPTRDVKIFGTTSWSVITTWSCGLFYTF